MAAASFAASHPRRGYRLPRRNCRIPNARVRGVRAPFKPVALVGFVPQHQDMSAGALPVVVGEIASLGTLLDWMLLEIIFGSDR